MKYLNRYKIFENTKNIEYIRDIFLDLRDNYFDIEIRSTKEVGDLYHRVIVEYLKKHPLNSTKSDINNIIEIMIRKYPDNPIFRYSEIESEIKSVVNYMISEGWSYLLDPVFGGSSGTEYHIDDSIFLRHMDVKNLTGFSIRFYRSL
jgi:hypothetical protein